MPVLSKGSKTCSFQCETKLGHIARLVWVGGLGLRKRLPIMGVLSNLNRREESMGASHAKLSSTPLQEQCVAMPSRCGPSKYAESSWRTKKEAMLNALLSGPKSSGGVYANINAHHDPQLNYSSLCLHCVST